MASHPEQLRVLRPEHFTVAPSLLGLPLARPSRRLFAMLIDLVLVAILVRAGGVILLSLASAWALFRFAGRSRALGSLAGPSRGRKRMWVLRGAAAFILFLTIRSAWNEARSAGMKLASMATSSDQGPGEGRTPVRAGLGGAVNITTGALALEKAENPEQAERAAARMVSGLRQSGASDADIRDALRGVAETSEQPWMEDVVEAALPVAKTHAVPPESLAVWHAAAIQRRDSAAVDSLRPLLASALARDSLDRLHGEVSELQKSRAELTERVDAAEHRGLLASIYRLLDELGIGFGWTGLYFTAFTALWKGQTPGKRLMGVRVLRLDGEPMTLWISFERFGGYAAGLVTGLLGFAQILWDRNRQAIHDKITETVVVRESAAAPPPHATERRTPAYRAPA